MSANYQTVFRLRGIPGDYGAERVRRLVRQEITQGEKGIDINLGSLSVDPRQKHLKSATLRFSRIPATLARKQEDGQWPPFRIFTENGPDILLVVDTNFLGFTSLQSPSETDWTMDIIAVTGLGGHAFGSWKQKGGSFMWLQDALPQDLPFARIMTYGYDTSLAESESFQVTSDLALQFNRALRSVRRDPRVPLVIIGHSLGGIVVKEALLKMHNRNEFEDHTNLYAICGILFFGVPNQGMAIESLIPMVYGQPNYDLLGELEIGSPFLRKQSESFSQVVNERLQNALIVNFYETKRSPTARWHPSSNQWKMSGPATVLVTRESGTHGCPYDTDRRHVNAINRNHSELVKFSSQLDDVYSTVLDYLQNMRPRTAIGALNPDGKPLRLLSISGSGYRGLGALLTLRHLLLLVNPHSPPKPCEVFHIIAGSGTGGLIAVLLGRFALDIETAIQAYIYLAGGFRYPNHLKNPSGLLEEIIEGIEGLTSQPRLRGVLLSGGIMDMRVSGYVKQTTGNSDEHFLEDTPKCKTFVVVSSARGNPQRLRNYVPVKGGASKLSELKIWKVCHATMATAAFFEPVKTKKSVAFLQNACIEYSNPVLEVLNEAEQEFPRRPISAVVSIQDPMPINAQGNYAPRSLYYDDPCEKLDQSNARKEKAVREMYCGDQGKHSNNYFLIRGQVDGSIARMDDGSVRSSMEAQIYQSLSGREYRDKLQTCAWLLRD